MAKFEITAKNQMYHNGCIVEKGDTYTINIPMTGIAPYNLFNNSRCQKELFHQLKNLGLDPSPGSPWLFQGSWNVKMVK